ncbi:MAG: Na(+)-translocating NADH-quinone reductase subunit C [Cardiobacteriaceae bacterium]|nr:Na(+)-translocating NADH-quinone reductase subunit C [Cardiobacteriaceae bacterium]
MAENKQQSKFQVLRFATIVCLACSILVSVSAVGLRPLQEANALNEKRINILRAAGLAGAEEKLSNSEINSKYQKVLPLVIDFDKGTLNDKEDPLKFDMYAAAKDPAKGRELGKEDPASIKRQALSGSVYVILDGERVERIVLPIQGYGLWSTMYGFLAVKLDQENKASIGAINFYSQAETPGLGARITEPQWQAKWDGLVPDFASKNEPLHVVKNKADKAKNEVDGIAGATLTSRGVQNLVNYWLSDAGYRRFIENVQQGKITVEEMKAVANKNGK